jgi:hypothetical protein
MSALLGGKVDIGNVVCEVQVKIEEEERIRDEIILGAAGY